ncbi:PBP1A family penicillin-binding protein [Clostridium sp. BJN0001]|uniref:transglycosylase domain-containing protein n=1 Tax=Clostridium sp. BJN0001 TaxID=2930219 RepID=UPI001FD2C1BC|nr:PBP1A family penicillin-binding protein [Clostridium sp. BJN0001]
MAVNNKSNIRKTPKQSNRQKPNVKSRKKPRHKIFRGIFFTFLFLFTSILIVGISYVLAIIKTTDDINVQEVLTLNQASSIYDKDGNFMDTLHTDEERYVIDSASIPDNLKHAFVSIEDERFYSHKGIDLRRIAGAAILDVKKILKKETGMHGASTITQQLIKNTVLTDEFSLKRKIKEAYLSLSLEKKLTKDQILTAYLNTIPLGGKVYGVEAAASMYFSKNSKDLSLIECAYIAGITQAPTYYSAYNEANKKDPSPYINRTITVLSKMYELEYITKDEYDSSVESVKNGGLVFKQTKKNYNLNYEWFVYPAVEQVKEDLKKKYKYSDDEVSKLIVNGGLKIYTTMDRELQDFTQKTLNDKSSLGMSNEETYDSDGVPKLQASATIMDYRTGYVLAMVGGRGNQKPQSTNRAYDARRSIGSNTKPLTVYGPGIDQKIITAATPIDDAPIPESIGKKWPQPDGSPWNPRNDPNEYLGLVSPREAIAYSKNVCSVITEDKVSVKTGMAYGKKLGIVYKNGSNTLACLALGQFNNHDDGGNTSTLASAFGSFGNDGICTKPCLYTKVFDTNGKNILERDTGDQTQVFSAQSAYIMYDLMKSTVEFGTGTAAKFSDMPAAGKTGTTTDSKDLWFSGLTPYYSASVWVGYDNKEQTLRGYSSSMAKLWGTLMKKAHEGLETKDLTEPSGIVHEQVCKDSGLIPTDLCKNDPRGSRVIDAMFIEGTEPKASCSTHVYGNVNMFTDNMAGSFTPSILTKSQIFIKKENPNPITKDYYMVLKQVGSAYSNENSSQKNNASEENLPDPPIDDSDENLNSSNEESSDRDEGNKDSNTLPSPIEDKKNNNHNKNNAKFDNNKN